MKTIEKDILTVEYGIIGHQVNCQGKMGAGLALKIAQKWPIAKEQYLEALELYVRAGLNPLGNVAIAMVADNIDVVHLFAQKYYGRCKQHTDYSALGVALHCLHHAGALGNSPIYLPHGLGCGLAGGDWAIVERLIEDNCPDAIICRWGKY